MVSVKVLQILLHAGKQVATLARLGVLKLAEQRFDVCDDLIGMHQPALGLGACILLLPERKCGKQHEQRHSADGNRRRLADKEVAGVGRCHVHAE